ncbi:hypothetical protein HYALB_00002419 [Hymenoscyphus albidus]|uniref:Adenosine deaminase domain-containing protein n=1 Tax=Hymenoscyphus albidus TaxID=595503 RepID=A0A9N9PV37_9HELO|nr:hypothetical protein HYALB_00002419 [Hymenoscyphus albidus]
MGILCSSVDKNGDDDPSENKSQNQIISEHPHRLQILPRFSRSQKPTSNMTPEQYSHLREKLVKEERDQDFDAECSRNPLEIERRAAQIVRDIRKYDRETSFENSSPDSKGGPQAEHFLGNVEQINKSKLFKVAKRMPKGAHLHIHFNSCLPAEFLIKQARKIPAMYIRSTLPLTKTAPENFENSRVSFMVMTEHAATHERQKDGSERYVGTGDIFSPRYTSNTWMRYSEFQDKFDRNRNIQKPSVLPNDTTWTEYWLIRKMQISEKEAHGVNQTGRGIWEKFNHRTQMMKGLFAYDSAYRNYTRECIRDFVADNIQYAEIRPNFMATNTLKSDDGKENIDNDGIMGIIREELHATMRELKAKRQYFGGMKVIYCTPRSFDKKEVKSQLDDCISLKKKHGNLLCGFDLVGHEEMGNQLSNFIAEFLSFRRQCVEEKLDLPFLFHCGETLEVGGEIDGNLYDAILLGSKRIGHGYALARHPHLMEKFKKQGIAIESCPISNEVLGLTPNIAGHNLPVLLANKVPCTINSDNATFYRSSLSHDFYQVMIGSESMSLFGWKQLAKWSLEHSCMEPDLKAEVTAMWEEKWEDFCHWIVEEHENDKELKAWVRKQDDKL